MAGCSRPSAGQAGPGPRWGPRRSQSSCRSRSCGGRGASGCRCCPTSCPTPTPTPTPGASVQLLRLEGGEGTRAAAWASDTGRRPHPNVPEAPGQLTPVKANTSRAGQSGVWAQSLKTVLVLRTEAQEDWNVRWDPAAQPRWSAVTPGACLWGTPRGALGAALPQTCADTQNRVGSGALRTPAGELSGEPPYRPRACGGGRLRSTAGPYLSRIRAGRCGESSLSPAGMAGDQGRKAERRWRGWTQPRPCGGRCGGQRQAGGGRGRPRPPPARPSPAEPCWRGRAASAASPTASPSLTTRGAGREGRLFFLWRPGARRPARDTDIHAGASGDACPPADPGVQAASPGPHGPAPPHNGGAPRRALGVECPPPRPLQCTGTRRQTASRGQGPSLSSLFRAALPPAAGGLSGKPPGADPQPSLGPSTGHPKACQGCHTAPPEF